MTASDVRENPPPFVPEAVFLDLDGTCLDRVPSLHPRIKAAVAKAQERAKVVIATGRMYRSSRPWVHELGLQTPLICYQGALIKEVSGDEEVLLCDNLDADVATRIIEIARSHGWHRQIFVDDMLLAEEDRPEVREYADFTKVPIKFVEDLVEHSRGGVLKTVYVSRDLDVVAAALATLRNELGDTAYVTSSLPHLVEAVSPRAGKGNAAAMICRHFGVDPARSLAVGDAPNDMGLLDFAAFGVAVTPVHEVLEGHCDATCAPPESAGVADVLEVSGLA